MKWSKIQCAYILILSLVNFDSHPLHVHSYQPPPNKRNLQWNERFKELEEYKSIHGDSNVPQTYPENLPLGRWVRRQRVEYSQVDLQYLDTCSDLCKYRIKKLISVGFVFNRKNDIWQQRFQDLKEFKKIYGHTRVPAPKKGEQWYDLAMWVRNQRAMYNRLIKNQDQLKISNDSNNSKHQGKGQMKMKMDDSSKNNLSNYNTYNFLTDERIDQLNSIGFCWDAQEQNWMDNYDRLVAFKCKHGHVDVPSRYELDLTLGRWVQQQKFLHRLSYSEYDDNDGDDTTSTHTNQSGSDVHMHKHTNSNNHKNERLTQHRVALLNELGFTWGNKKELKWWDNYKKLRAYFEKCGTCSLPPDYHDVKLKNWVINTRRRCSEYISSVTEDQLSRGEVNVPGLNEERIEALRKINFYWLPTIDSDGTMTVMPQEIRTKVLKKKLRKLRAMANAAQEREYVLQVEERKEKLEKQGGKAFTPFPWDEI